MKHLKLYEGKSDFDRIAKMISDSKHLLDLLWDVSVAEYLRLCDEKNYYPDMGSTPRDKRESYVKRLTVTDYSIDKNSLYVTLTYYEDEHQYQYYLTIDREDVDLSISTKKFGL